MFCHVHHMFHWISAKKATRNNNVKKALLDNKVIVFTYQLSFSANLIRELLMRQ